MSVISPEDLINDIKPWEKDSWKKFVENEIGPLHVLADAVAKQFVGDAAADISKTITNITSCIIDVARNVIGDVQVTFTAPEDPIECLRQLVERGANMFLGVGDTGKYTLFAWSLRKITKEYLFEALYPTLKDNDKRRKVFNILGIDEDKPLFKPMVKSPLADSLTILGYKDYPSICSVEEWGDYVTFSILPSRESTLGGNLCKLVDALVALLKRPGILSSIVLSADVIGTYLSKCPEVPTELYNYTLIEVPWKDCYQRLSELSKIRHDYAWSVQGFAVRCVGRLDSPDKWDHVVQETNLLSFLRRIMPSLIMGRMELLISSDWRVFLVIKRT